MAHEITYLEDDGIIFTDYAPPIGLPELQATIAENLAMAAEKGAWLFLGDCRRLPTAGSVIDVYELGQLLDELGVDRRMREALVVELDPAGASSFDFYVTVTTNRGIQVRLFAEMDEAKAWLVSEGVRQGLLSRSGAPTAPTA
jgi:hypothetical protein